MIDGWSPPICRSRVGARGAAGSVRRADVGARPARPLGPEGPRPPRGRDPRGRPPRLRRAAERRARGRYRRGARRTRAGRRLRAARVLAPPRLRARAARMRETAARNVSRLARELRARPLLRAAVRSGVVSARKAQVILPLASSTDEAAWVERARTETVRALEVAVRAARGDAAQASVQVEEEWERVDRDLHRAAPGDRRRGGHADVCGGPDHAPGPPAGADPVRRGGPRRAGGLRRVAFARRVPGKDGGALHSDLGAAPSAPPHARTAGARSRRRPLPGPRLLAACRPGPPHRAPLRRRRGRRPEPHLALRRPPPARRARGQRQRPRRGAGPAGVATRTARVAVQDERRESNSVHGQRPSTAPPVPGGNAQDERAQSNSVHRERPSTSPPCVRLRSGRTGESNSFTLSVLRLRLPAGGYAQDERGSRTPFTVSVAPPKAVRSRRAPGPAASPAPRPSCARRAR